MSPRGFAPRPRRAAGGNGYPLPPALSRLPAGAARLPREFLAQDQRDRILLAALEIFGTRGFAAATVTDLSREAAVSRETFYRFFDDKSECLAALHDELLVWLAEEVREAAAAAEGWAAAVLAVTARLVGLLADDIRVARLCTIEYLLGGAEVVGRQEAALAELAAALRMGRVEIEHGERLPDSLELLLLAGAGSLVARSLVRGVGPGPAELADELAELILIFYLGSERARAIVRG
ncbi:MAG TPA: helix-turn-helix domain-containing protein [Solirubrobacterales bacterium]|nr:helix-turn-helix domain-containing protein [Solirubrobacterales bacterium]